MKALPPAEGQHEGSRPARSPSVQARALRIRLLAVTAAGAEFGQVGYEVILLYIACLTALVISGSGPFAIDGLVRKRFEAREIPGVSLRLLCGKEDVGFGCPQRGKRSNPGSESRRSAHATLTPAGSVSIPGGPGSE